MAKPPVSGQAPMPGHGSPPVGAATSPLPMGGTATVSSAGATDARQQLAPNGQPVGASGRVAALVGAAVANASRATRDPWLHRQVGHLQIASLLRRGPLGPIYLARDVRTAQEATFKPVSVADKASREKLIREAQVASALSHPHLLAVYGVGEYERHLYIVSEYLGRGTLADWVALNGPVDPAQAAGVVANAALGLAHAHQHGVTHRDVRPAHVHLGEGGLVKLGDFGLARTLEETRQLTQSGMEAEQLLYVAPEICRGQPSDSLADVYSLGCVLYFLLAGQPPFAGGMMTAVLQAKMSGQQPDITTRRGDLPAELVAILERATRPEPRQRLSSAEEFSTQLQRVAQQIKPWRGPDQSPPTPGPVSGKTAVTGGKTAGAKAADTKPAGAKSAPARPPGGRLPAKPQDGGPRPASSPAAVPMGAGQRGDSAEVLDVLTPLDSKLPGAFGQPGAFPVAGRPPMPLTGEDGFGGPEGFGAAGGRPSIGWTLRAGGGVTESVEMPQSLRDLADHSQSMELPASMQDLISTGQTTDMPAMPGPPSATASPVAVPTAAGAPVKAPLPGGPGVGLPGSLIAPVPPGLGGLPRADALGRAARLDSSGRVPPVSPAMGVGASQAGFAPPSIPAPVPYIPGAGHAPPAWSPVGSESVMGPTAELVPLGGPARPWPATPLPAPPGEGGPPSLLPWAVGASSTGLFQDTSPTQLPAGTRSAPPGYEILDELGRGGMGVVFRARDQRLGRVVALKMLLAGAYSDSNGLARFRTEAQAVAALQHPNIVQIFETGEHEGLPFFSLEFCEGGALASRIAGRPQPPRQSAQLVELLARAVEFAHRGGVIHRDLKPANVLLTTNGTPKITDFGLAKRADSAGPTATGASIGTPSYMPPEQVEGTRDIGPAVDIYSLGAVLYELLTGRPPFVGESPVHTIWQVISQEPVAIRQLAPKVPADLETICLKCLAKNPAKRYPTAQVLGEDLRAFLENRPIKARPVGPVEKALKWAARKPAQAALAAVSVLASLLILGGGVVFANRLNRANDELRSTVSELAERRREAESQRQQAEETATRTERLRLEAEANRQRAEANRQRAEANFDEANRQRTLAQQGLDQAFRNRYVANARLAEQARDQRRMQLVEELLDAMRPRPGQSDLRGFEWFHLARQLQRPRLTLPGQSGLVLTVAFAPDGKTLAAAGARGAIRLLDPTSGRVLRELRGQPAEVFDLVFSEDSKYLYSCGQSSGVLVWEVASGQQVTQTEPGHGSWTSAIALVPGRRLMATLGDNANLLLWPLDSNGLPPRTTKQRLPAHQIMGMAVAVAPDGRRIATVGIDIPAKTSRIVVSTLAGEELVTPEVLNGHEIGSRAVVFSRDGQRLFTGGVDGTVITWNLADNSVVASGREHFGAVSSLAVSPDGTLLASAGIDGSLKLWSAQTGAFIDTIATHKGEVFCVRFSPDGQTLATACSDGFVRLWDIQSHRGGDSVITRDRMLAALAVSDDGQTLAIAGAPGGGLEIFDMATAKLRYQLSGHMLLTTAAAFIPGGRYLVSGGAGVPQTLYRDIKVWDTTTGQGVRSFGQMTAGTAGLAVSPDGRYVAAGGVGRDLRVYEFASGRLVFEDVRRHGAIIHALAFAPDNQRLVTASVDGQVRVWDIARRILVSELITGQLMPITSVTFSADGHLLASAGTDGAIRLWDANTYQELGELRGSNITTTLGFSPDGQVLAGGCIDGLVKLWDVQTRQERATLRGHTNVVTRVVFTPDGQTLATVSVDKTARLWRTARDQDLLVFSQSQAQIAPDNSKAQAEVVLAAWGVYLRHKAEGKWEAARQTLGVAQEALTRAKNLGYSSQELAEWSQAIDEAMTATEAATKAAS